MNLGMNRHLIYHKILSVLTPDHKDPSRYDQTGGKTIKNQKLPDFDWPFLGYSELPNNRFWLVISPDIGLLGAKKAGRNSSAEIRNGPSREGGQNLIKSSLGSKW